jgi:hypothetical protein
MGSHFVVNKLSVGNTSATDPLLLSPIFAFWKQEVDPDNPGDPCGGGGPGPGPYPDLSLSGSVNNSTSSSIDPEDPPTVVCAHWW